MISNDIVGVLFSLFRIVILFGLVLGLFFIIIIAKNIHKENVEEFNRELRGSTLHQLPKEHPMPITHCNKDFGAALDSLKAGYPVFRRGWNGKGIFLKLQKPDEHSKMKSPYIYIDTTDLETDNPDAPRTRVPWTPSQTDLLAEDWEYVDITE